MVRGLMLGAVAFLAVFAAERQLINVGKDLKRYNAMREMSGDPPFLREVIRTATRLLSNLGASRQGEARDLVASLSHDLVRYATMRRM